MRNLDKSTRIKEIAKKDNLPLEVLQLDVTDDKSVADAIMRLVTDTKELMY